MRLHATIILMGLTLLSGCAIQSAQPGQSCTASNLTTSATGSLGIRGAVIDDDLGPGTSDCCAAIAQSFTVFANTTVSQMELKLKRVGYPADGATATLTLTLLAGATSPTGTTLATGTKAITSSSASSSGNISTTGEWVNFAFTSTASLTANTVYWITATADYTPSDAHVITWMGADSNTYAYGYQMFKYMVGTWTQTLLTNPSVTARDLTFKFGCT